MRVIAGVARSTPLIAPEGLDTRPTTDKTKETLFNVLMPYLYSNSHFLDLFSGSGSIGIEALSRGVEEAVFIEKSKAAVKCINANLAKTHFDGDMSTVYSIDVFSALHQLEGRKVFDLIFLDPPYNSELEKAVLIYLSSSKLLDKDCLIIVEASLETEFDYLDDYGFYIWKRKDYKNNCHVFIKKVEE